MALKPLPKAILIALVVVAVGYGLTKVLPDQKQAQVQQAETPTVVAPPAQEQVQTAQQPEASAEAQPQPAITPSTNEPTKHNVTNGDAGLNAVLGAGR